jgi:hypothetical protein
LLFEKDGKNSLKRIKTSVLVQDSALKKSSLLKKIQLRGALAKRLGRKIAPTQDSFRLRVS